MYQTKIQEYLTLHGLSLEELETKYGVSVVRSEIYPSLYLFIYRLWNKPDFSNQLTRECRGIILDSNDNWKIVSYSYEKFFNYNEPNVCLTPFDFSSFVAYEKLDGSLIQLYYYGGRWNVATSGNPDAAGNASEEVIFRDLFWNTFNSLGYKLPPTFLNKIVFSFELCTSHNRIICKYPKDKLVLHGARDLSINEVSYQELSMNQSYYLGSGWEIVKRVRVGKTLEEVVSQVNTLNPEEYEGYVLVDCHYNRIKVKSQEYFRLHRLKGEMTNETLLDIVLSNEIDEAISYAPEYRDKLLDMKDRVWNLSSKVDYTFSTHKHLLERSRKDFALVIKAYSYSGILFNLADGRYKNAYHCILKMDRKKVLDLLELNLAKKKGRTNGVFDILDGQL